MTISAYKYCLCILALNVVAGVTLAQSPSKASQDKDSLSEVAVIGFAANLQGFPFYQCRYRFTSAQARSVEDAIQGAFVSATSYENRLLVDGEKDLYEGLAPPLPPPKQKAPVPEKKGFFFTPAVVCSNRYLGDGKHEMNFIPQLGSMNLFSKEKTVLGIPRTPMGMGFMGHRGQNGPGELSRNGLFEMVGDGLEEIEGRPLVAVRFKDKQQDYVKRYWFDPERGYLPIRYEGWIDGKLKIRSFVTHVRECSNQRWFPERSVRVITPDKAGDLYDVWEVKLLELDADKHPAVADFTITVPAGTTVCDHEDPKGSFKLQQEEQIHVDDIPKLFAMLDQKRVTPLMATAIPRSDPLRWLYWAGIGAGMTLTLTSVWFIWRKFRTLAS